MDIYLNWDNEKKSILLPINPESFEISGSQNNQSLYVHNLGEINLKGKRGLYSITLESFFPSKNIISDTENIAIHIIFIVKN